LERTGGGGTGSGPGKERNLNKKIAPGPARGPSQMVAEGRGGELRTKKKDQREKSSKKKVRRKKKGFGSTRQIIR